MSKKSIRTKKPISAPRRFKSKGAAPREPEATRRMPMEPDVRQVLSSITNALVGHFEMPILLDQVVSTSMEMLRAEVCSIFLVEQDKDRSVVIMRAGSGFAKPLVGQARYELGEGFTGYIALHKKGFNIRSRDELETLEIGGRRIWQGKHDPLQWASKTSGFRNLIALPLTIKGECLGVIKVENKQVSCGEFFTEDESRYFEIIANVVALAIESAKLHLRIENQLKAIAGKAAHRINNQATNYDGIELLLAEEYEKPVPDRVNLQNILRRLKETTQNLKRMTTELKNYGKPLVLELTLVDLNNVIRDEVWLARPQTIEILTSLDPKIPRILLDAPRFAEAIKELLRNSIKAINRKLIQNGTIQITTKLRNRGEAEPGAPDRLRTTRDWIQIRIHDSGPGFPTDFPAFEPFHTTDPSSTGLGLATVKELIEAHGGRIWLVPAQGARIEMELPATGL